MAADFQGKAVLVTGAGRGKGRVLAEAFAAHGARVAAVDISPVGLDELAKVSPEKIRVYPEDVAKKVAVQAVVNQVEDDFGRIDILINHAAVEPHSPILDMDEWDWHRVLDVNLTGAFLMIQSVGRVMRASTPASGVIVNLIPAARPDVQNEAAYLASMHGLVALTRAAAQELAPFRIRVHAVGTGIPEFHHAEEGIPADLAGAVLHLCDSPLNGQIVNVEES